MENSILLPLDGTITAEQAIPTAAAVARRTGAELHPVLVHLTDFFPDARAREESIPQADHELVLEEREYLESIAEVLARIGVRVRPPAVLHGDLPDAVVEYVAANRIGGVVMSTHGRGALERMLVPSVAQGLRRRLPVPMILVPVHDDGELAADVGSTRSLSTVLVALDGSRDAEAALDQALALAGPEAKYVLLRVISLPPQLSSVYLPRATIIRHGDEERLKREAGDYLSAVEQRIRSKAPRVEKRLGTHSRPGHLIVRAAEEVNADLIAVGSHGQGALREVLLGSVTQDVVREGGVPVLITRVED